MLLAVWLAAVLWTTLAWHPTPLYSVESDTIGEYIPAAQDLGRGVLSPAHYQSKGFGYPAGLAAVAILTRGDHYLAARLLNVAAAVAGATFAGLLFRAFLGAEAGWFVLAGLLLNPAYLRGSIEAATDVPTFALLMAATFLLLHARRPRGLLLAGFLAGWAVITRYNCVFLPVAGILLLAARRGRWNALAAYSAGLVLPLGAWALAAWSAGASLLGDSNVMNVAYEVYGRGLTPEAFWATTGVQFHSFADVVRHQPGLFAARIAANLATRWVQDARTLLPVWLGALALPGIALGGWRRPGWPGLALHAALCYAALALVFYQPRFGLYLVPFYLSGAVVLILHTRLPGRHAPERASREPSRTQAWRRLLLAALIVASGWRAVTDVRTALATAPGETREAGLLLRGMGRPGDRVMARKPNVAYFARMSYVPLPDVGVINYDDLLVAARRAGARYLFFSAAEEETRPQFGMLADPGVALPGLRPIGFRVLDARRYYALYEFTGETADPLAVQESVLTATRRFASRRPGLAWAHTLLGGQLLTLGRYREALGQLDVAERLDPRDLRTARMQVHAHERLGEYNAEVAACDRAIALGSTTGWERARLGWVRMQQGRFREAIAHLDDALRLEPGNLDYAFRRGLALRLGGDLEAATRDFESVLAADRGRTEARIQLARVWSLRGDTARALAVLEAAATAGPAGAELRALADSLRARPRAGR